ncbi:MAG: cytochrome c [Magnetococcales bacterium]|nr:cytochrome c [Magnetococcales bacterium]
MNQRQEITERVRGEPGAPSWLKRGVGVVAVVVFWVTAGLVTGGWEPLVLAAPSAQEERDWYSYRRDYYAEGQPADYLFVTNPYPATRGHIVAGGDLYRQFCAECHGADGFGFGYHSATLSPPPARLAFIGRGIGDEGGYLFWSIAEGGIPLGSDMPAYKERLTTRQIWQIILFLQQL